MSVDRFMILFLLVLITATAAFAQKETGAIEGTVVDSDARPIPGVTVTASSPSLIGGTRTAYTNESGFYRLPVLPPGAYEVKAELNGFQTITRKGIVLSIITTLTVDFTLQLLQTTEVIEVTGDRPPLIDATTTAIAVTVPPEIVSALPRSQDIQNMIAMTPGVTDDLVAFGAPSSENSFWVDGVNMSNPRDGGKLLLKYDQNWIDQVQVSGIGAPAEYGGFTGVVANFVTRSGGNQFHGLFETFFQNQDMVGSNWPDPPEKIPFKTYDISTNLGGPILKDKLWFFVGYQYPQKQIHPPDNADLETLRSPKMLSKLTYKWNDNNTLQGFVQVNHNSDEDFIFAHPEVSTKSRERQVSWNATWISILRPSTTLEARLGGFRNHYQDIEDHPDVPSHHSPEGFYYNNNPYTSDNTVHRIQSTATLSHHADHFLLGGHDFRFGVEVERSHSVDDRRYNGGMFYYDYDPYSYYGGYASRVIWDGERVPMTITSMSAYAQDEWRITDRFTASMGARWDHNRLGTDVGQFHSNDPIAPRLGLVWNLDKQNETVIKAHYGLYYEALLSGADGGVTNGHSGRQYQNLVDGKWVDAGTDSPVVPPVPNDLKQPVMKQFDVGVEHVLPWHIPVGIHYIARRWDNIITSIDFRDVQAIIFSHPITGDPITYYKLIGPYAGRLELNLPGLFRRYDGVELFGSKYFPHRFSLMGSLVYSDLRGNSVDVNGNPGIPKQLIGLTTHQQFRLYFDHPLVWKISGSAPLPWGFNAGWYFRHESGKTWNATAIFPGLPTDINVDPPGFVRRLPSRNITDLRFEKEFPIYAGQARFTIDVFNLFNSGAATEVWPFIDCPCLGEPAARVDARSFRLGARYTY